MIKISKIDYIKGINTLYIETSKRRIQIIPAYFREDLINDDAKIFDLGLFIIRVYTRS